ncbi:MAG: hypothetical protein H6Q90_2081 [Deltaproteobacteria bacterium]|nr:hypothetical protein [Deltaproteobacteria bacterium]
MSRLACIVSFATLFALISVANADPVDDCQMKLVNVQNNLPASAFSSPSDLESAGRRIALARKFYDDAQACLQTAPVKKSPDYGLLLKNRDIAKKLLDWADGAHKQLQEFEALDKEMEALKVAINQAPPDQHAKIQARYEAFKAKFAAAAATNPHLSRISSNLSTLDHVMSDLGLRKGLADTAAAEKRMLDGAVTARFPSKYRAEDSLDQDKIAQAFAEVDPADLVMIRKGDDVGRFQYQPANKVHERGNGDDDPKHPSRFGVFVAWNGYETLDYFYVRGNPVALGAETPGLLWNTTDGGVILVTLDGGRYVGPLRALVNGRPSVAAIPKAPQNLVLMPEDLHALVASKVLPASLEQSLTAAGHAAQTCSERITKSYEAKFRANDIANITIATRNNRAADLRDKQSAAVYNGCVGQQRAVQKAWNAAIEAYGQRRSKTLEAVRARLGSLAN